MKEWKRFLSLLLATAMCVGLLPIEAHAGTIVDSGSCGANGDDVTYTLDSTGLLTISGEGAIANWSFKDRNDVITVVIQEGITRSNGGAFWGCGALTRVIFPDSITEIGSDAFFKCSSLRSIIIPHNVTTLGFEAFYDCTALTTVYFTGNAPNIQDNVFGNVTATVYYPENNDSWEEKYGFNNVLLKGNHGGTLTWVPYDGNPPKPGEADSLQLLSRSPENNGVFSGDALTVSMTFNHEVESVQTGFAFDEAGQIVSYGNFSIVREIEEADSWKFETVYSLSEGNHKDTDVTIDGSTVTINASSALLVPGETYYVLMDNGVISFKDTDERIGFSGKEWGFTVVDGIKSGTFRYKAQYGETEYPYYFDESWFQKPSTEYNHELAKMSLRASIAAYGSGSNEDGSEYIQELMGEKLGFQNLEVHYPTPQRHSIGYAIGSKTIASEESASGAKSLIMVAIRGGEYKAEWAGNFMVGDTDAGDLHEGFLRAAEQVEDGLRNYIGINQESLNDECVVWIVGYSRAAATANLLAKKLDDGSIEGVGTNNVFAYCFECPQNSRASNLSDSKYNNIMNIVNPLDFVTMVVPADWGYGRYGQTFFLPYVEGVTKYNQLKDKMIAQYSSIIQAGSKSGSVYDATYQAIGQRDVTDGFFNHWLADEFVSPEFYNDLLWQEALMRVIEAFNLNSWGNDFWEGAYTATSGAWLLVKLGLIIKDQFPPKEPIDLIKKVVSMETDIKAQLAISLVAAGVIDSGDFIKTPITYTHWPELCMAWMDSLTGDQIVRIDNTYRRVLVNCPVDVSVYDSEDTLVGRVIDRNVQEIEDGVSVYIDENEQIVISLPITEEYRVEMDATGEGTVTYTVTEYNIETNAEDRVVSYAFVEVETNDVLVGQIENLKEVDSAEYSLTYNGELLIPSVDQSDDAVERYTVTTAVEGDGSTNGGGKAVYGEYRKLTATPDDGAEFIGWFVDGEQVSKELEYRFCVTGDITVTAKFTLSKTDTGDHETVRPVGPAPVTPAEPELPDEPVLPENPFADVHENDFFYDAVIWAVNNGITSGSGADTFAPDRACTRAEMVTFLWRAAGTPEPVSGNNPFTDVTETDYFYKAVLWAVENGITKGTSETTFSPNDTCTRGQTVTFLYRYAGAPEVAVGNPFADVQENNYYYHAVIWAVAEEITKGTGETTFSPNNFCTRSQIVTFLYRYSTK